MKPSGSNVSTIGDYIQICKDLSEREFCNRFPHGFLLHSQESNHLIPTDQTHGFTLDRLVLDGDSKQGGKRKTLEISYSVFQLQPKNQRSDRVSIGCSSSCDVQINDRSISSVHAFIFQKGKRYIIQDNNSAAGTMIDDSLLGAEQPLELSSGNRITLGYIELIFLVPEEFYRFIRLLYGIQ